MAVNVSFLYRFLDSYALPGLPPLIESLVLSCTD